MMYIFHVGVTGMKEKLMQKIIIKYPSEVLNEDGLAFVDREVTTGNRRLDIVLKDRMGRMILVEAQVGNLDTDHIDRHIDFVEGFLGKHPNIDVRVMYVANTIDPLRKRFLERRGYEYKEISEYKFKEIAEKYDLLNQKEIYETDSIDETKPVRRSYYREGLKKRRQKGNPEGFRAKRDSYLHQDDVEAMKEIERFWIQYFKDEGDIDGGSPQNFEAALKLMLRPNRSSKSYVVYVLRIVQRTEGDLWVKLKSLKKKFDFSSDLIHEFKNKLEIIAGVDSGKTYLGEPIIPLRVFHNKDNLEKFKEVTIQIFKTYRQSL